MTSPAERIASQNLRMVLRATTVGSEIQASKEFQEALSALEYFLPEVLRELYKDWKFGGLDQVISVRAEKTNDDEIEILGICCLIEDQTLAALHVRLQLDEAKDEISWLECRLGEQGPHGVERKPYRSHTSMANRVRRLAGDLDNVDWCYSVTIGERRR